MSDDLENNGNLDADSGDQESAEVASAPLIDEMRLEISRDVYDVHVKPFVSLELDDDQMLKKLREQLNPFGGGGALHDSGGSVAVEDFYCSDFIKKPEDVAILLWFMDNFDHPQLTPREREAFKFGAFNWLTFGKYEEGAVSTDIDFTDKAQERGVYLFLRCLLSKNKVDSSKEASKEHVAFLEDAMSLIVRSDAIAYPRYCDRNPSKFYYDKIFELARANQSTFGKENSSVIADWEDQWERWVEKGDTIVETTRELPQSPEERFAQRDPFTIMAESQLRRDHLERQSIVTNIIHPDSPTAVPEAAQAWDHPLDYLNGMTQGRNHIFFDNAKPPNDKQYEQVLPPWCTFQLAWLQAMSELDYKKWKLIGLSDFTAPFCEHLKRSGFDYSNQKINEMLQDYLDQAQKGQTMRLRTYLSAQLEQADEENVETQCYAYWEELAKLVKERNVTVNFTRSDLKCVEDFERKKSEKLLFFGRIYAGYPVNHDQFWLEQHEGRPDIDENYFVPSSAIRSAVYQIGINEGRGLGDERSVAVPIKNNNPLIHEFTKGELKEYAYSLDCDCVARPTQHPTRVSDRRLVDALVITVDGDSSNEQFEPPFDETKDDVDAPSGAPVMQV